MRPFEKGAAGGGAMVRQEREKDLVFWPGVLARGENEDGRIFLRLACARVARLGAELNNAYAGGGSRAEKAAKEAGIVAEILLFARLYERLPGEAQADLDRLGGSAGVWLYE